MQESQRNRFRLDEDIEDISEQLDDGFTISQKHSRRRFRLFLSAFSLLVIILVFSAGGLVYYFYTNNTSSGSAKDSLLLDRVLPTDKQEQPEDRYYIPKRNFSSELLQATQHYQNKELRQATARLEGIVNGSASDEEKAVALTYLGVIALERERYPLARHQFLRSLRYNDKEVGAIVNLSILERRLNNYSAAREYALQARKLSPKDKHILLLLGNVLLESHKTDDAISTYEMAISGLTEDALVYYNLGLSHARKENVEKAIENFKKSTEKSSSAALAVRAYAHIGQLYFQKGDLALAIDYLKKAVNLAPENAKYLYNLGVLYLHKKEPDQALVYLKRSLAVSQGSPQIYRSLARAFQNIEQPHLGLAMDALVRALHINPGDLEALFQLGDLQHQLGQLNRAAATYRKIVNITPGDKNTRDALHKSAKVYLDMERFNSAIDVLERSIQLKTSNPQAYFLLGKVYQDSGRRDLAIQAWKKGLSLEVYGQDSLLSRQEERQIRLALAQAYRKDGAFDLAIREYKLIQGRNQETPKRTEDPQLFLYWGKTHVVAKDFKNAILVFKKVGQAKKASLAQRKEAWVEAAQAYVNERESVENISQALVCLQKARRLDNNDVHTQLVQAWVLIKSKSSVNTQKALDILNSLTSSKQDSPKLLVRAYNLMGLAYMENKEYQRALNSFDYALQLDPANKEVYRNQQAAASAYEKGR